MSAVSSSRLLWGACALLLIFIPMVAVLDPRFGGQDFDPRDPLQLPLFGTRPRIVWVDPLVTSDGVLLKWSVVPGAETYDVVFYSVPGVGASAPRSSDPPREDELFREPSLRVPQFTLTREAVPEGISSGTRMEAQIDARRGGVRIAESERKRVVAP